MKNRTKANLLKTRGIIKKAAAWTPAFLAVAGLGLGLGFLIGGGVKADNAVKDFKETPVFAEVYNQEYDKIRAEYDSGEITAYDLAEKMNYINDESYPRQVLEQVGDEAKEYKAELKTGITYQYAAISGLVSFVGALVMIIPWMAGPEVGFALDDSGDNDFYEARELLKNEPPKPPKRKKGELEDTDDKKTVEEEDDEERLPNIEDRYYKE